MVGDKRCTGRSKTVHRRGGCHDEIVPLHLIAYKLAAVVDGTRPDGNDQVCVFVKSNHQFADCCLVRYKLLLAEGKDGIGEASLIQRTLYRVAAHFKSVAVAHDKSPGITILFHK